MLSLLNDNCNISNFTVIIWYTVSNVKVILKGKHLAYSYSPEPFTSLFTYISWEKKYMKVLQNHTKENKN